MVQEIKLSLICPTIGRSTLARLIEEVGPQLTENDEFIIVSDGYRDSVVSLKVPKNVHRVFIEEKGDYGCSACDYGIEFAKGDFVWFIGDDDHVTPNAFEIIRKGVQCNLTRPHLFSMIHTGRRLGGIIASCNVSGQQIVVPRDMAKMPKMADCPKEHIMTSDYHFIARVQEAWGGVVYHDEIIAILDKQNFGKHF